ncbi:FAD-binding oxidoreductase [Qipengyuania sp. JC766]|uniref:FAD-binding oxidoreductase n=1 Tax=Qipengyuania sp. JC766 TaxID=3232139 RepID=UPI00345A760E
MDNREEFLRRAGAILGDRGLVTDPELLAPWLTDWRGRYTGKAMAMAQPSATQEVSALVALCAEFRVPIVPQGGNSGMSGGATPDESGDSLLLSMRRMDRFRAFDPAQRQITCEAGVVLQTLHEKVREQGLRFPLTLGGKGSATIGGLVSTNAGGTQVLRHGTMGAQVLGLEVVLADGSVLDGTSPLKKDNRGFDPNRLFIGSEGTLGIVTAVTLALIPDIAERRVVWAGLDDIKAARRLLVAFQDKADAYLEGFEVVPQHSLEAVLDYLPNARNPLDAIHPWSVLVELVGGEDDGEMLQDLAEAVLGEAFEDGLIQDATIAANESQAEDLWLLRESIAPAERGVGPAVQHDVSVPVARMADFIDEAVPAVEKQFPGTRGVAFGHLGDGNVHFHVRAPAGAEARTWEDGEGKAASAFVHDLVTQWDGSISAEHGIGQIKVDELARLTDPARLSLLGNVKRALDPQNLLNPGKLLALAPQGPTD